MALAPAQFQSSPLFPLGDDQPVFVVMGKGNNNCLPVLCQILFLEACYIISIIATMVLFVMRAVVILMRYLNQMLNFSPVNPF